MNAISANDLSLPASQSSKDLIDLFHMLDPAARAILVSCLEASVIRNEVTFKEAVDMAVRAIARLPTDQGQ